MLKTLAAGARPASAMRARPPLVRRFLALPGTEPQSFSATRVLPYASDRVYEIIADIDSYASFIPYCLASTVTRRSLPDREGRCWPAAADLTVGWGSFLETFTSRLYCVPGTVVEAVGGSAVTSLPTDDLALYPATSHHRLPDADDALFRSLRTTWSVSPLQNSAAPSTHTVVSLCLHFQFASPLYALISKSVTPKVAQLMIDAFEARVRAISSTPLIDRVSKNPPT